MSRLKKLFSSWKIWVYLIFLVLTVVAINPNPWADGVAIRSVMQNTSSYNAGMQSPSPREAPRARERIIEISNMPVSDIVEFERIVSEFPENTTMIIKTTKNRNGYIVNFVNKNTLGLSVYDAPKNNIILGLELQGGTRVILQPETKLSANDMDILLDNMQQRINVFGLTDIVVRSSSDLAGNQFIIVEVAGANEQEVKELLSNQGKFEAKIGNETVFLGGQDITFVCRTADCSGIDPNYGCQATSEGYFCRFRFSITLTPEAAERQANATRNLDVVYEASGQAYLSQSIDLYLDDTLVDSLRIGSELKGNPVTDIQISGSGSGRDRREAISDSQQSMKQLQTILITGSLPVRLEIIKTDTLSPSLGKEFMRNALFIAIIAEIAVVLVVLLRYKKIKVAVPIITIITSEILLILGVSALLKQNLDIAGIAGIIIAIGTGVDDQIIITDELLGDEKDEERKYKSWVQKLKSAFFIVFAAYFASVAAMIPLLFAGAGLLKGFAVTTLIGVTNGVFITRPAFAEIMKVLLEEDNE